MLHSLHTSSGRAEGACRPFEIIRHAASADPGIGTMWDEFMDGFYENQRLVIERFAAAGVLRKDRRPA
jgi:hypothetical protein